LSSLSFLLLQFYLFYSSFFIVFLFLVFFVLQYPCQHH
jgi:hypothetical protein